MNNLCSRSRRPSRRRPLFPDRAELLQLPAEDDQQQRPQPVPHRRLPRSPRIDPFTAELLPRSRSHWRRRQLRRHSLSRRRPTWSRRHLSAPAGLWRGLERRRPQRPQLFASRRSGLGARLHQILRWQAGLRCQLQDFGLSVNAAASGGQRGPSGSGESVGKVGGWRHPEGLQRTDSRRPGNWRQEGADGKTFE